MGVAREIACWVGGPNPAMRDDQSYSQKDYERGVRPSAPPRASTSTTTIFVDSVSVASRLCFQWCKGLPQATSDRNGKADLRGAYGVLGQEMIAWLTHLQHTPNKNVWLVGLLDKRHDDFNRPYYSLQVEGSKTGLELPGIVDEIITLTEIRPKEGEPYRAFVCTTINDWGFPAKDRSGRLSMIEPAHLGRLMEKIRGPMPQRATERLSFELPALRPIHNPHDWSLNMTDHMDFNGADAQDAAFGLIPAGTLVKIRLTVRPGSAGPDRWLTQSRTSAALYLNTEAVVLDGPHARRRIYTRIGYKGAASMSAARTPTPIADGPCCAAFLNPPAASARATSPSAHGPRAPCAASAI